MFDEPNPLPVTETYEQKGCLDRSITILGIVDEGTKLTKTSFPRDVEDKATTTKAILRSACIIQGRIEMSGILWMK